MVSVIIPCYNYGHLITDTIDSLLTQTYRDIEVIVINDGSKDNTEAVVSEIAKKDSRVRLYSFPNGGLGTSRNRGLEKATGDYIQFLDADDLLEKNKFDAEVKLFSAHPEADIVYGSVRYFKKDPYDPNDRLLTYWGKDEEWMPRITGKGTTLLDAALTITPAHLSSVLFKKNLVDKIGLFDNELSPVADYDFLLRCCLADAYFLYHDTPLTYSLVRWHPDNMSKDLSLMFSHEIRLRKKLHGQLPNNQLKEKNLLAIKSHELRMSKSWKAIFLSGGKFDKIKVVLQKIGLLNFIKKRFHNHSVKNKPNQQS